MADNYLERQRDLYEARKAAWEKQRKYGKKKHAIHLSKQKAIIEPENVAPHPSATEENE